MALVQKPVVRLALALVFFVGSGGAAYASRFSNQFSEFELPPQWQCALEGAEWVCQNSGDEQKKKEAIIILAAKLRGDQDSLDQYLNYLKAPKKWTTAQGKPLQSDAKYTKTIQLNEHPWVDSLHVDSEVPDFYTRYLATVKDDIGVLITYSIHKDKYQFYLNDFDQMVKTLRVFRRAGGLNAGTAAGSLFQQAQAPAGALGGAGVGAGSPDGATEALSDVEAPTKKPSSEGDDFTLYLLLGGLVVGFILWKKRQNG